MDRLQHNGRLRNSDGGRSFRASSYTGALLLDGGGAKTKRHMFSTDDIQNVDATMSLLVVVRRGRPAAAPIIIGGDLLPLDPMHTTR